MKYLLIGDNYDYEIFLGNHDNLAILQLEAIIDSVVDSYKMYGLDVEELIENIKRDAGFTDEEIKVIENV